jgi:hypothetical protein
MTKIDLLIACDKQTKRLNFLADIVRSGELDPAVIAKLLYKASAESSKLKIDIATFQPPFTPAAHANRKAF